MAYNAVVHLEKNQITRIKLTSLKHVPKDFWISYRGEKITTATNPTKLFHSDLEPLHIFRQGNILHVQVKSMERRQISISAPEEETVKSFLNRVEKRIIFECPTASAVCYFKGKRLKEHHTLQQCDVRNGDLLMLNYRYIGTGDTFHVYKQDDFEGEIKGRTSKYPWQRISIGLNIPGKCSNKLCLSNSNRKIAVFRAFFGRILVNGENHRFRCPSCGKTTLTLNDNEGLVLSCGKTLVRYRESLEDNVKFCFSQTSKDFRRYNVIRLESSFSQYEHIECTTVSLNSSPFSCAACDHRISGAEDVFPCGHRYHRHCLSSENGPVQCIVCNSELFSDGEQFLKSVSYLSSNSEPTSPFPRTFSTGGENFEAELFMWEFELKSCITMICELILSFPADRRKKYLDNYTALLA